MASRDRRFSGLLVPVVTPFSANLDPDTERFCRLGRSLLAQGANGLAVFGTTGEANSLTVGERLRLLDALLDAGVSPTSLMVGTGACALGDAVVLGKAAVDRGCGGVLMLPPFYYKAVSDQGLFDFFAATIDRIGSDALRIYLYHIPPISQVPFSLDLIGRLTEAFPETVVGIKDSSRDWAGTARIIEQFPGFTVFTGSEAFLLDTLRAGGAGCITATGNVNARAIAALCRHWRDADADARQASLSQTRRALQAYPMVPALKAILARATADPEWARLRPPLCRLDDGTAAHLFADLDAIGFAAAGIATTEAPAPA